MTQYLDHNGEVFHETGKGRWGSSQKDTMTSQWEQVMVRVDEDDYAELLFPTVKSWEDSTTAKHWENQAEAVLTAKRMNEGDDDREDEDNEDDNTGTEGESQSTTMDAFDPLPNSTRHLKESKWKELSKNGGWYPSNGPVRIRLNPYPLEMVSNLIPQKWKRMNEGRREAPNPGWKELPTVTMEFIEGKVALFSSSENTGVLQLVGDGEAQTVSDLKVRWAKDGTVLGIECRLNGQLLRVASDYDIDDDQAGELENVKDGTISSTGAVKIFDPIAQEDAIDLESSLAFAYPSPGLKGAQFPPNLQKGSKPFADFFDKGDKWFGWMKPDKVTMMATLQQYENTDYEGEYLKQLAFSESDADSLTKNEALFVTVKLLDSTNGFTGNSLVEANQGQIALMFPGDESDVEMGSKWGGKLSIKWDKNSKTALLAFDGGGSFHIPSSTEGEIEFKDKTTFGDNAEFKGTVLSIEVMELTNVNRKYASIKEQRRKNNLNTAFTHFQTAKCPVCTLEMATPCERIDCPMPVETTTVSFAYEDDNENIVIIVPKDTSADGLTNLMKITLKEKGDDE
jgi:hypothetical protein